MAVKGNLIELKEKVFEEYNPWERKVEWLETDIKLDNILRPAKQATEQSHKYREKYNLLYAQITLVVIFNLIEEAISKGDNCVILEGVDCYSVDAVTLTHEELLNKGYLVRSDEENTIKIFW